VNNTRIPLRHLKYDPVGATINEEGGRSKTSANSVSSPSELVEALDAAIGAVAGMFAIAAVNPTFESRTRLDEHYETLITAVEAFREAVPKA